MDSVRCGMVREVSGSVKIGGMAVVAGSVEVALAQISSIYQHIRTQKNFSRRGNTLDRRGKA
jgi:hypothetical protein